LFLSSKYTKIQFALGRRSVTPPLAGRKVQTGVGTGMGRKLRLEIAGIRILYPHAEFGAGPELTGLESNRNERD